MSQRAIYASVSYSPAFLSIFLKPNEPVRRLFCFASDDDCTGVISKKVELWGLSDRRDTLDLVGITRRPGQEDPLVNTINCAAQSETCTAAYLLLFDEGLLGTQDDNRSVVHFRYLEESRILSILDSVVFAGGGRIAAHIV